MSNQTVPLTAAELKKKIPANVPQFEPVKNPVRFAIHGKKHMTGPLATLISEMKEISPHFKAMIQAELANVKTNAAQVDLHVVDHANGDISIQAHIKQIQLG